MLVVRVYLGPSRKLGGVAEWLKALVLKTSEISLRGFESLLFRNVFAVEFDMTILIIILPFLGFLSSILFSRYFGRTGSAFLTTSLMFINVVLTGILFFKSFFGQNVYFVKIGS